MAQANAQGDLPGLHSINHFAIEVPDLKVAENFYEQFGLTVTRVGGTLELRASGGPHRWGRIFQGKRKRLGYLALNCYAKDLEAIKDRLRKAGAAIVGPYPGGGKEGFWCRDPDDNLVQVLPGEKTMPNEKIPLAVSQAGPNERGVLGRSMYGKVHPRRMSHVLMFTPDVLRQVDFYENVMGLRLSDRSQDLLAFLHARYGSDHHMLAFAKSSAKGWHHSSWDVPGIEDVGRGADQMARAGFKAGWGTGRHVLGSNYFHYVQDPWGSFAEYSADIDYVPAGQKWESGNWPPEDSLYLWGPDVPEIFLTNTEAAPIGAAA